MKEIPVIIGPTGSGKTEVALHLAVSCGFVVINADSRKIYRYLDIGTAKPGKNYRKFYRLIDILDPCENFSAYEWAQKAEREIENVLKEGNKVIVEGASVLYLKALFEGFFEQPHISEDVRIKARKLTESGEGYEILKYNDPETAEKVHPRDKYRIGRALEILIATGKPMSYWRKRRKKPKFKPLYFFIDIPRDILYKRIESRAKHMFDSGLVEETKRILEMFPCFKSWGKKIIAYKQSIEYIEGKYDYKTAIRKKVKADKVLSRRQVRFMRTLNPRISIPYHNKELLLSYLHLSESR